MSGGTRDRHEVQRLYEHHGRALLAYAWRCCMTRWRPRTRCIRCSRLSPESRAQVEAGLRAVPETGFDWADAMRQEERALAAGIRMNAIPNLRTQDLGALRSTVSQIVEALRLPPDRARSALANVSLGSLPFPSPLRVNEQREAIRVARQKVLDALAR
jgi:hypothetical protein